MSSGGLLVRYENLRTLGFASVSGSYSGVGPAFQNPVRILKVTNTTNENLRVSFDGITDMDIVAANGYYVFDYTTNDARKVGDLVQAAGQRLYVKHEGVAPTLGTVYVTIIYAATS